MCELLRLLKAVSRLCQGVERGGGGVVVVIGEQGTSGTKSDRKARGAGCTALGVEEGF